MTELDQIWSQMLDEAAAKADDSGHRTLAEYLRLKATNDAIRERGVGWLLDAFVEIAGMAVRDAHGITIERQSPHRFTVGSFSMTGSLLSIRHGVRCLTIEAGWARTPSDGIMRRGALAQARITHFGMPKSGAELRLVHVETLPTWLDDSNATVDSAEIQRHFDVFLDK